MDVGQQVRGVTPLGRNGYYELLPSVKGLVPGVGGAEVWNGLEAGICMWEEKVEAGALRPLWKRRKL